MLLPTYMYNLYYDDSDAVLILNGPYNYDECTLNLF